MAEIVCSLVFFVKNKARERFNYYHIGSVITNLYMIWASTLKKKKGYNALNPLANIHHL